MTALDTHNHADLHPVAEAASHLTPAATPAFNADFRAASAATGRGAGAGELNQAVVSPDAIHFGTPAGKAAAKPASHEAAAVGGKPHKGASVPATAEPDADHPLQSARALMNMSMTQGRFDQLPKDLVHIAERLGENGMFGLSAAERKEEAKLSPYLMQNLSMDTITSTAIAKDQHFSPAEVDAMFKGNSATIDALEDPRVLKHMHF